MSVSEDKWTEITDRSTSECSLKSNSQPDFQTTDSQNLTKPLDKCINGLIYSQKDSIYNLEENSIYLSKEVLSTNTKNQSPGQTQQSIQLEVNTELYENNPCQHLYKLLRADSNNMDKDFRNEQFLEQLSKQRYEEAGSLSSERSLTNNILFESQKSLDKSTHSNSINLGNNDHTYIQEGALSQPRYLTKPRQVFQKILITGTSALGKTTFAQTMLHPFIYQNQPGFRINSDRSLNKVEASQDQTKVLQWWNDFQTSTGNICSADQRSLINYTIQEMPFALNAQTLDMTIQHIEQCDEDYLKKDLQGVQDLLAEDSRFDLCIYFVPPSGDFDMDVQNIKRFSQVLPVIPVISKSETLQNTEGTDESELQQRKRALVEQLDKHIHSITQGSNTVFPVCAAPYVQKDGTIQALRNYSYGECHVLSPQISDSLLLKNLVFEDGLDSFKHYTRTRYALLKQKAYASIQQLLHLQRNGGVQQALEGGQRQESFSPGVVGIPTDPLEVTDYQSCHGSELKRKKKKVKKDKKAKKAKKAKEIQRKNQTYIYHVNRVEQILQKPWDSYSKLKRKKKKVKKAKKAKKAKETQRKNQMYINHVDRVNQILQEPWDSDSELERKKKKVKKDKKAKKVKNAKETQKINQMYINHVNRVDQIQQESWDSDSKSSIFQPKIFRSSTKLLRDQLAAKLNDLGKPSVTWSTVKEEPMTDVSGYPLPEQVIIQHILKKVALDFRIDYYNKKFYDYLLSQEVREVMKELKQFTRIEDHIVQKALAFGLCKKQNSQFYEYFAYPFLSYKLYEGCYTEVPTSSIVIKQKSLKGEIANELDLFSQSEMDVMTKGDASESRKADYKTMGEQNDCFTSQRGMFQNYSSKTIDVGSLEPPMGPNEQDSTRPYEDFFKTDSPKSRDCMAILDQDSMGSMTGNGVLYNKQKKWSRSRANFCIESFIQSKECQISTLESALTPLNTEVNKIIKEVYSKESLLCNAALTVAQSMSDYCSSFRNVQFSCLTDKHNEDISQAYLNQHRNVSYIQQQFQVLNECFWFGEDVTAQRVILKLKDCLEQVNDIARSIDNFLFDFYDTEDGVTQAYDKYRYNYWIPKYSGVTCKQRGNKENKEDSQERQLLVYIIILKQNQYYMSMFFIAIYLIQQCYRQVFVVRSKSLESRETTNN